MENMQGVQKTQGAQGQDRQDRQDIEATQKRDMQKMYDDYGRQAEALEVRQREVVRSWRARCPSEAECKRYTMLGDMLAEVEWARRQMIPYVRKHA